MALQQLRIFVVDDEDVIASTLATILRYQGGFHATSFNSPLDALQAAQLEQPDLLISDVVMPQLSGIDLAIQLQQHCPGCKILLFSGHIATTQLVEQARANGFDFELFCKPVHPAALLARIEELTENHDSQAGAATTSDRSPAQVQEANWLLTQTAAAH